MAPGHYIREWRKFRGMTMVELAERVDMSHTVLSRLERGQQRYNQALLEQIAEALRTTPADLIMRDPALPSLVDMFRELTPAQKETAEAVIQTLRNQGPTNDR